MASLRTVSLSNSPMMLASESNEIMLFSRCKSSSVPVPPPAISSVKVKPFLLNAILPFAFLSVSVVALVSIPFCPTVTSVVNAYKKVQKDIKRQEREDIQRQLKEASLVEHYTNFTDSPYDRMACGNWIAADDGICTWNSTTGMLAASVWADPSENKYIGNFKSSDVGLEVKADMLNNLPLILDDTGQKDKKIEENFERIVYDLCSGQGKTRSNKELGLTRESTWKLCILTNGEYPLQSYVNQGGAVNRILEVECTHDKLFENPQDTIDILKKNYGFAGKDFVAALEEMSVDKIKNIQQEILKKIASDDKTDKQLLSLSIVLTADRIATDMLFKDMQYIDIQDAKNTLADVSDVSPNERCYEYLVDMISMNEQRFDVDTPCEKWGDPIEKDEEMNRLVYFYPTALNNICKNGGYSKKAFLSWGMKMGLVISNNKYGNVLKRESESRNPKKFCCLKVVSDLDGYLEEQKASLFQISDPVFD